MTQIPMIKLHDGYEIPQLGFGTLSVPPDREPTPENTAKTAEVVASAIKAGYRMIDTAQMYGNEQGVGDGIRASGVPRAELFVTTKLGNGNHRPDDVKRSFDESITKLGLDYIDLFLMHWPLPTLYDGDFVATWRAMIELQKSGRVRSIGVSNFQPEHLERIIAETGVVPAVNQVELHPGFNNGTVVAAATKHGIAIEAWSPLAQGRVLDEPALRRIAEAHGKSVAQVILRWHIQLGNIIFPKSMRTERMQENLEIFDFELTSDEMQAIDVLDEGEAGRDGPNPDTFAWVPSSDNLQPKVGK